MHGHFQPTPHESASHSRICEHTSALAGIGATGAPFCGRFSDAPFQHCSQVSCWRRTSAATRAASEVETTPRLPRRICGINPTHFGAHCHSSLAWLSGATPTHSSPVLHERHRSSESTLLRICIQHALTRFGGPYRPSTCASTASAWGSQRVMSMARYRAIAVDSAVRASSARPVWWYSRPSPW
jgi:hypothetical protein